MTKRISIVVLSVFVVALIVGCSSTSNPVTGTWTATATSSTYGTVEAGSANLVETNGNTINGTWTCNSSTSSNGCSTNASETVTGTVSGSTMTLNITQDCNGTVGTGSPLVATGTLGSNTTTYTGNYTRAVNASCGQAADTGTFSASK
jgi:hypothetical protein